MHWLRRQPSLIPLPSLTIRPPLINFSFPFLSFYSSLSISPLISTHQDVSPPKNPDQLRMALQTSHKPRIRTRQKLAPRLPIPNRSPPRSPPPQPNQRSIHRHQRTRQSLGQRRRLELPHHHPFYFPNLRKESAFGV